MSVYLWVPLLAWAIAQIGKLAFDLARRRRLHLPVLFSAGGMPSSHVALTVALSAVLGKRLGSQSPLFATSAILSFVVMYDAAGVRRAAGRQAALLNRLMEDFFSHQGFREERLRELLGHTPVQVLAGAGLGLATGLWLG